MDYHTFGLYNFAVIHWDVRDDLAYRIVKAVFEHHQEMVSIRPAAKKTIAANIDRDTFLPLRPIIARSASTSWQRGPNRIDSGAPPSREADP